MHEYSIIQALLERVEREAATQGATGVHRICVSIGELAGVERELLATAFDTIKTGTICATTVMEIRAVPARWECPKCHGERPAGQVLRCPQCQVPARLLQGDEIILDRIEMEINDV